MGNLLLNEEAWDDPDHFPPGGKSGIGQRSH